MYLMDYFVFPNVIENYSEFSIFTFQRLKIEAIFQLLIVYTCTKIKIL